MELTGICDKNMRYVMIDEVQDYTISQLRVFRRFFPNARFMLLGDEFQAIREGTLSFKQIEELAKEDKRQFVELPLLTSYRSSPEITDIFSSLLPEEKKCLVSSVQREGEKVEVRVASSDEEYYRELKALIDEHKEKDGLTAIICRNTYNLEKISAGLSKSCPKVIEENDSLPKQGVFLIELALAKGLEFDNVIIADGDDASYPEDELGKHCLYTAVSRATKKLSILAKGTPAKAVTSFLP